MAEYPFRNLCSTDILLTEEDSVCDPEQRWKYKALRK